MKKKLERHAAEEFENKKRHATELTKFKERLRFIIDNINAIARDKNVYHLLIG